MTELRILFVCTAIGMRSTLAVHALEGRRQAGISSCAAGFAVRDIPDSVLRDADSLGLHFESTRAESVFDVYKRGDRFDYVITLCDPDTREGCASFRESLQGLFHLDEQLLHWPIPHPGSPALADKSMPEKLREIMERIDGHIDALLAEIESRDALAST